MSWDILKFLPKKFLGIDIGTSAIRVVELGKIGNRLKLENYAEVTALTFYKKPFRTFEKSTLWLSSQEISRALKALLQEAGIKTKKAVFAIPDFSSFFTWFNLPPMSNQEVATAVRYEARQHIPLPLSEVALDWQITEGRLVSAGERKKTSLKILLVAVPREVINQYQEIARLSQLEIFAVEAEVFALARALVKEKKRVIGIVDIGAQSTTISIIDNKMLKRSHSFDISGNQMTETISKSLGVDYTKADWMKAKYGLLPISQFSEHDIPYGQDLKAILAPLLDTIIAEIDKSAHDFSSVGTKDVERFILAGGTANMPGLKDYFRQHLGREVEIADSFADIFYPPILEDTVKRIGPLFSIAVGTALRGLE